MAALARLLLQPANFLLLDEPTNHLDMRAKDVLLQALQNYSGTVVFVSHDRYFMDKLATRVFEIGSGEVKIYPGNYEDYLWRISGQSLPMVEKMQQSAAEPAPAPQESAKRVNPLKLQKMKVRLKEIEQETNRLESEIQSFEQELGVFVSAEQRQRLTTLLEAKRGSNEKLMAEWETLSRALESI